MLLGVSALIVLQWTRFAAMHLSIFVVDSFGAPIVILSQFELSQYGVFWPPTKFYPFKRM